MSLYTFKEEQRIRKKGDFERAYAKGMRLVTGPLVVYLLNREDDSRRLGITISRKVRGAVKRNRAKRLIREVFRTHHHRIEGGCDMVVVGRVGVEGLSYWEMRDLLTRSIDRFNADRSFRGPASRKDRTPI